MCTSLSRHQHQAGVSLVELVVFIVVVSVGVVGLLGVTGSLVRFSPDPMVRKQMMAIADSLLTEVLSQPFTFCDLDDANVSTATLSGTTPACAVAANNQDLAFTPQAGETRLGGTPFDNVADYRGYSQSPVTDITSTYAMSGYGTSVAVANVGTSFGISDPAALQVTVTVSRAGLDNYVLTGYRFRYAPRN